MSTTNKISFTMKLLIQSKLRNRIIFNLFEYYYIYYYGTFVNNVEFIYIEEQTNCELNSEII